LIHIKETFPLIQANDSMLILVYNMVRSFCGLSADSGKLKKLALNK